MLDMLDFKARGLEIFLKQFAPALLLLIVGIALIKLAVKLIKKLLGRSKQIDPMLNRFILSTARVIMWVILILSVVQQLGFDTSSFLTIFAAAGAAVALALKDSLSNLAGGILIMFTKPFSYGDYISCGGMEGSVDSIDLLYTTINTADNKKVSIPNSHLTSSSIINYDGNEKRRVEVKIGVSYDCDLAAAKYTMLTLAKQSGFFLDDPAPLCHVLEYADYSIVLSFRGWVQHKDYWNAFFYMNNNLKDALDSEGIEIPYPQLDVHRK